MMATNRVVRLRGNWAELRRGASRVCLVAALIAGAAGACSTGGELTPGGGGLAPTEAEELTLTVAQLRAQYPQLSATGLDYQPRTGPRQKLSDRVGLALRGSGRSVTAGVSSAKVATIAVDLFLDKSAYQEGYAEVRIGQEQPRTWPVLAHDQRGTADKNFEFIYILGDAKGTLAYLVVLGGTYEEDGKKLTGFEGTLVLPGPGATVVGWTRAYKLDFGFRFPAEPAFLSMVEKSSRAYRQFERQMSALERIQAQHGRIETQHGKLVEQAATPPKPERAAKLVELEQKLGKLQSQWKERLADAETQAIGYFELRRDIAGSFADFLESNLFRWRPVEGQRRAFTRWREADRNTADADALSATLLPQLTDSGPLSKIRREALDAIARHGNGSKAPK